MSRFNKTTSTRKRKTPTEKPKKVGNLYKDVSHKTLHSLLTTMKLQGSRFYSSSSNDIKLITDAVDECVKHNGPEFTAKLLVLVRTKDGHRSSIHVATVALMPYLTQKKFAKYFFSKRERSGKNFKNNGGVIFRLDDMSETLSFYASIQQKGKFKFPNAMKKGFKKALEDSDWYLLAKYQMKSKNISLVDLINLTHPRETESRAYKWISLKTFKEIYPEDFDKRLIKKQSTHHKKEGVMFKLIEGEAHVLVTGFEACVNGWLKQENTMEDKNSKAGIEVAEKLKEGIITQQEAKKELQEAKKLNFAELLDNGKLGYLALLRNLGNILKTDDSKIIEKGCTMLVNKKRIQNPDNLIWPGQIEKAFEFIEKLPSTNKSRYVLGKLAEALDISTPNLVDLGLDGDTALVIDSSGSMRGWGWGSSFHHDKPPIQIASLLAAIIGKATNADLFQFASTAAQIKYNPLNSIFDIAKRVLSVCMKSECGHGTNFGYALRSFPKMDRIFILSDLQNGREQDNAKSSLARDVQRYVERTGAYGVYIYLININSYGTTMLIDDDIPSSHATIVNTSGYSFDTLERLMALESNPEVLKEEINSINLLPSKPW